MNTREDRLEALLQSKHEQDELWREVGAAVARMPREEIPIPAHVLAQLESLGAAPAPLPGAAHINGIRG